MAYGGSYVLSLWMDLTKYSFFCFLPNRLTDGLHPSVGVIAPFRPLPFDPKFGPLMINALPGYWEQDPTGPDSKMCPYFQSVSDELLTAEEKAIACKTQPRTPPKIIDLDLLDKVIEQIKTHDFENTGPLLQVFSTMMLHLPMAYPAEYNEAEANDEYRNGMPEYFASGKIKPPASIDDNRWATNQGVRIKEFALSTICLDVPCRQSKMPDNGITQLFTLHLTMEAPFTTELQTITIPCGLRSSLLSKVRADVLDAQQLLIRATSVDNRWPDRVLTVCVRFLHWQWIWTGGIRVPQFISGGWIDQQLPAVRKAQSNTYIFPNDIAPTLLEMAGGDVSFLLGGNKGAPYGSPMWKYIKNSIDPTMSLSTHQRVRKVSYTPDMFFDVQEARTMKFFYTGSNPMLVPRLYEPVWPKTGDLIMDTVYTSVKPCRPNGVASDCCSLNIELDWQETTPLLADCQAMRLEAQNLFAIEGGCPKDSKGRNTNLICLESGDVNGTFPKDLTLWTHYGAAGLQGTTTERSADEMRLLWPNWGCICFEWC